MAKLTIKGNTKPIVGNTEAYSLPVFDNVMTSNPFSFPPPKVKWDIYIQDRNGWRIAKGNIKEGENVTYKFTAKSLKYKALRIEVIRGKDKGELYIKPQETEEPKIVSVELQDINSERLPKGKLLHYTDTIIAKAHCVGMFGYKVAFTLWEDDAIGKGHDPIVNMMNKINQIPLIGEVNHEGVAKVYFRLPAYTMAVQIANAGVARGDKSEGKTHEYYVTAEVVSKHILKASPNVNVANPAHIPPPPKKAEPIDNTPPHRKPPVAPEHNKPKPNKPKPKEETAKFPVTPAAKKQADPEGKIVNAEFTDGTGKTLKNAKTGDTVSIKITSQGMRGKNVMVRIWEEDFSRYSNDLVYEVSVTLAHDTSNFINNVTLTKEMYNKSNDFGEGNEREYFIEVEHLNTSVTSQVIPISPDAEPVKVDPNDSPAIIKEPKQEKKEENVCECEAKVRAFMRMLRVKEGSEGESGYTKLFGHENFTKPPHNKDMSTHPKIVITAGGYSSSAAGAYQIMQDTYKGFQGYYQDKQKKWHYSEEINYIKKYKISSFDQESQDKLCLVIFKHNYRPKRANSFFYKEDGTPRPGRSKFNDAYGDIIQMIIDDNFDKAILTSSLCWASLPNAPYGQPTGTKDECKANYEKFLKEEIAGKSDLYLKKGFLKGFGYTCCDGNNESNGVCPDDCSQCFDYADVWENPEISTDNGGKNNNRFGYNSARGHKGIDIVSGPEYKDVHSLMCGEIVAIVDTFKTNQYKFRSLGNTLMIKSKDKDGKTVFILYCHLNKIYVKKGDKVKHGQKVAQSGSTGNASSDEFPNGVKGSGINKRYWHCHVEAATKGEGYNNFRDLGAYRIKAEDYMKTKFDKNGNTIK
ncbi:peptidoglycan DD-metalloendopeptidase family protein [Chryseobacterium sp. c4a]|uniref:peptidoglycan DD-metalloendopeptidase family protein n=1 Tax=Chryseobacterium sp. c4a TaxID=1573582 RepID=UPI0013588C5F|nr:peptidoglycan DD-metalloendopeptidase family protein [Chryseobacterium sp. c4a]